jgi:two-component sensor histidine kinase
MTGAQDFKRPAAPPAPPAPGGAMTILCVDDEPAIRLSVQVYLEDQGHRVEVAEDGVEGLRRIRQHGFDAVLLDLAMPGLSGLEVLRHVAAEKPALPVVVVSGTGAIQDVISALRLGAWDFITKPIEDMAILRHSLERVIERARLILENQRHREKLEELVRERTQALTQEIAERENVEQALRKSLNEKEVLLREVHHRVKNNLQVVTSLLSLQALKFDDPRLSEPFMDSQSRVRAMALVHEKLYRAGDLSRIDFAAYLQELTLFLVQAYSPRGLDIDARFACDSIHLPVDAAVPCGLLVNELVTNSIKHAFKDREHGRLTIRAMHASNGVILRVEDDGVGMPPNFEMSATETLGLQLVSNLVRQLHGGVKLESGPGGTAFELAFPI